MMDNHTPGPWFVEAQNVHSGGRVICRTDWNIRDQVDDANARLIAAAPELLEALEALMAHEPDHSDTLWENALAAIAKAKGQ